MKNQQNKPIGDLPIHQDVKPGKLIKSDNRFPVVGIGASAGGLDAFKRLLNGIPEDSGMAYVLVQHLDPSHESLLPELLKKVTSIPVLEISDDIKVEPNHIYVLPSNKMMVANDGVLQLTDRPPKSKNTRTLTIDHFFTSLAEVHQSHAIGVVLSGTASDGTIGLKAIKDYGGVTFAQDEESAAYESMPHSAVEAGVVDFILPPEQIPLKILEVIKSIHSDSDDDQNPSQQDELAFKQIISLLRIRKGTDFTYYKQTTVRRRIRRRMALHKKEEPASYLKYLRAYKPEQDILYQDMLIPVTGFFRDTKSFDNLCETIFPLILKNKSADEPIRVWIAACSTGQEAYSIAISLKEFLGEYREKVQIFATDISEPAIAKARVGIYTKSEVDSISPQRLKVFFKESKGSYQVNKQLRDMCIFAVHDFLKDPPFGKMDLISCRNVLIYMDPYLQEKALSTFHYALNPKGFLFLGKSETTGNVADLFTSASKNDKLFSRKDGPGKFMYVTSQRSEQNMNNTDTNSKSESIHADFQKTADDIMLDRYTPAGVVVNEVMDILYFRGNTSEYLMQSPGKPSHNLLKMAKDGLAFELRNILHKAKKEKAQVIKENVPFQSNDRIYSISIEAIPLLNSIEPHYLILFHDRPFIDNASELIENKKPSSIKTKKDDKDLRIQRFEQELAQTREDMRSITEDQEAVNEELQSANEELVSSSEELQSLNEELETNKEELQSTNEELIIVNHEISSLNQHVTEARDYAEAIVATIHEPMLILDGELRVKSANQSFYKIFNMTEKETKGKLLYDMGNKQWNIPSLRKLLEDIITKNSSFHDLEFVHVFPVIGEKTMVLNANRIVQKSHDEKLILLAIYDVTEIRMKIRELQIKEKELLRKDIGERKADKTRLEKAIKERTRELEQANKELVFQNEEKGKRAAELNIANIELIFQNEEKGKRAAELIIANRELIFQNEEKGKRAAELIVANKELVFQNEEKEKRAIELLITNKELQSFAYVSSHDLQEPLRKIQTFADRMIEKESENLSDNGKDYLKRMQLLAGLMQQLIDDLLAFSRINTKERKFKKTELHKIAEEVTTELRETIDKKNATVDSSGLGDARIIPFQFRQLMHNLIGNALKFSKPIPAPLIIIKSRFEKGMALESENSLLPAGRILPEKDYYHISVADNGIGFEPHFSERIFEVFQKLHHKDEYDGTGIGLAIVKRIVENHNGIITAKGEHNKGATFDIYIPEN